MAFPVLPAVCSAGRHCAPGVFSGDCLPGFCIFWHSLPLRFCCARAESRIFPTYCQCLHAASHHCRLVDFHHLYLSREDGFLNEQREISRSGFRQQLFKFCVLFGIQAETVFAVCRIAFGLPACSCSSFFLHVHEILGLYFFLFRNPRLWSGFSRLLAGLVVFVGQKTFCRTKTQLALFA